MNIINLNIANKDGGLYINPQGKLVQSSMQTAEMLNMSHNYLLRIINRHKKILDGTPKVFGLYYIEAKYKDKKNELRKCYELTQQGFFYLTTKLNSEIALKAQIAMTIGYDKALSIVMDESVNLFLNQGLYSVKWYAKHTDSQDIYGRGKLEADIGVRCSDLYREEYKREPQKTKDINYGTVNVYYEHILKQAFAEMFWEPEKLKKILLMSGELDGQSVHDFMRLYRYIYVKPYFITYDDIEKVKEYKEMRDKNLSKIKIVEESIPAKLEYTRVPGFGLKQIE